MTKKRKTTIAVFVVLAVLALVVVPVARLSGCQGAQSQGNTAQQQEAQGETADDGTRNDFIGPVAPEDKVTGTDGHPASAGATSLSRDKVAGSANIDSAAAGAWENFDKTVTSMLFVAGQDPDKVSVTVSNVTASAIATDGGSRAVRYVSIDGTWHVFEFAADGTCTHHELTDKVAGVNASAEEAQANLPTDGVDEI